MYLLMAEEGSNSKWNPIKSIIKRLVPLFGPVFTLTVNPPTGVKELNFQSRIWQRMLIAGRPLIKVGEGGSEEGGNNGRVNLQG